MLKRTVMILTTVAAAVTCTGCGNVSAVLAGVNDLTGSALNVMLMIGGLDVFTLVNNLLPQV